MDGRYPEGKRVLVYDDDHYYMGGVLAESLVQHGKDVTLITPAPRLSEWTFNTLEQAAIHRKMVQLKVQVLLNRGLQSITADGVISGCVFGGADMTLGCDAVVIVASRESNDALYRALCERRNEWAERGLCEVKIIGDADAPGPIAWATYAGHRYARELDEPPSQDESEFKRELAALSDTFGEGRSWRDDLHRSG